MNAPGDSLEVDTARSVFGPLSVGGAQYDLSPSSVHKSPSVYRCACSGRLTRKPEVEMRGAAHQVNFRFGDHPE